MPWAAEESINPDPPEIVFSEDGDVIGWSLIPPALTGFLRQTEDAAFTGKFSLEKTAADDPSGGYKALDKTINRAAALHYVAYRYSPMDGGTRERLAIIDSSGNGYGPNIYHDVTGSFTVEIERRDTHFGTTISSVETVTVAGNLVNQWYEVLFDIQAETCYLEVYDSLGQLLVSLTSNIDTTYTSFSHCAVYGGWRYYVDQLKVYNNATVSDVPRLFWSPEDKELGSYVAETAKSADTYTPE